MVRDPVIWDPGIGIPNYDQFHIDRALGNFRKSDNKRKNNVHSALGPISGPKNFWITTVLDTVCQRIVAIVKSLRLYMHVNILLKMTMKITMNRHYFSVCMLRISK